MIRKGRKTHPRMLANVLKAIADMKDNRGSSIRKIVEQVAHGSPIVNKAGKKPRNVTMQVRRALRHGVNTGLLVQHAGKYRLGLDEADSLPVKEVRRRRKGRKGRKGRGRRRRRGGRGRKGRRRSSRASSRSLSDSEASPVSDTSYTSVESEDAAARRSRKAKRTAPKNQPERSSSRKKKRVTEDDKGR